MKMKFNTFVKILSLICVIAVAFTSLLNLGVISALTDGSDDSTVSKDEFFDSKTIYSFELDEDPVNSKSADENDINMTRGGDGKGIMGWTWDIVSRDNKNVLYTHNEGMTQTWATAGGYRLNNFDGVYRLKPATSYVVKFNINMISNASSTESFKDINTSTISLGYGSWDAPGDTNTVNSMSVKLFDVVVSKTDETVYTVNSSEGAVKYDVNSGWKSVTCAFTTPESFGNLDNALSFFATLWPGARVYIDDVEITALNNKDGAVILTDDYHGKSTVVMGKVGEEVELPVITPENAENKFEGWYKTFDRKDGDKVEQGYKFTSGLTTLYARFDAPVSVTFVNSETGEKTVVTGRPGEQIKLPQNPTVDGKWFMGWYFDELYTKEFDLAEFDYSNRTVYGKFINPPKSGFEDFETYTSDEYTITEVNGAKVKSNYPYFAKMMSKVSDKTYNNSKYAIRLEWDKDMVYDKENPDTYEVGEGTYGRWTQYDTITILEDVQLDNNTQYLVKFKYFVEKTDGEFHVSLVSGMKSNAWGDINVYKANEKGSHLVVSPNHVDGEWHQGEMVFTTNFKGSGKTMFFAVNMPKNIDVVVYFDNFEFTPIAPDESYIKYDTIATSDIYVGKIGSKLPVHTPDYGKHTFLGWYSDAAYTAEFTEKEFGNEPIIAYAKWNQLPITFENDYFFDQSVYLQFGKLVSIVNSKSVGNGDDYAVKFTYDADKIYSTNSDGTVQLQKDRYKDPDHTLILREGLKADTVYLITYDVRAENTNLDYSVNFCTGTSGNVWGALNLYNRASRVDISKSTSGKGWVTKTVALKTPETTAMYNSDGYYIGESNALYLYFNVAHNLDDGVANVYVDNILIEEAPAGTAVFMPMNYKDHIIVKGEIGEKIVNAKIPIKFAYTFEGWYNDANVTEKFSDEVFGEKAIAVYAKYTEATTKTFDYEDYNVPYTDADKKLYLRHDCEVIPFKNAYSGNYVMKGDRSFIRNPHFNTGGAGHLLKSGDTVQKLKQGTNYIITFKYYVETHGQEPLRIRAHAGASVNFWGSSTFSSTYHIALDEETNKWHTGTLVCDGNLIEYSWQDHLYISWTLGKEGMYYFDDFTVTELPEGQMAYFIDNGGCKDIPEYVLGKVGQNFASQLPKNPKYENHSFLGYYVMGDDGKYQLFDDYVFRKDKSPQIVARFIRLETIEDFETYYLPAISAMPGYNVMDFDYELYDAEKEGNSKDNVTNGRYSLHRKGEYCYSENALVLTQAQPLVAGEKYTVTFKVKMGEHKHTNGAVKIVSNNSPIFAWVTYGDYYPVIAITDLADGQWHEVTYTFTAIEPYVAIQTPGDVELFFDEFKYTYVPLTTPVSTPVQYTEYSLIAQDEAVDISTIIDVNLGKTEDSYLIYVIIGGAVLVVALAVFVLIRRKNKKGGQK